MRMDTTSLREAGLTDGEIKVYLALLELGATTTGPIIEKSGIARSIIYQILDKLMQKGLVSMVIKDKTKHFQATEPTKILEYIGEREEALQKNKEKIEKLLPQLMQMQTMAPKNVVSMYLGFKGIRTAHEHLYLKLKRGDEYYYLGVPPEQPEEQHLYWQRDHLRRDKAGIRCKLLFNKDTDRKILKNRNSYKDSEARYMPTDMTTPACFGIFGDTVIIFIQIPHAICIEIVNQDIADSFKAYFDEFWKRSDPFKR